MKKAILLLWISFIYTVSFCQADTIVRFYNASWKETNPRYASYYTVAAPENNVWHRIDMYAQLNKVQMNGYYTDTSFKTAVGPFEYFYKNGQRSKKGNFHNGKKTGVWRSWNKSGALLDSTIYDEDIVKYRVSYYDDGTISDSTYATSENTTVTKSYWQGGALRSEGQSIAGKRQGLWSIYAPEGYKSQAVQFAADSAVSVTCFDAQGRTVTDCIFEREAEFKGGQKAWLQYLQNALSRKLPAAFYRGELEGIVVVQFVVDKDGKVTDATIDESTEEKLNDAALSIIRSSPRWIPAIQYNRPVKAYRKQPLTFILQNR